MMRTFGFFGYLGLVLVSMILFMTGTIKVNAQDAADPAAAAENSSAELSAEEAAKSVVSDNPQAPDARVVFPEETEEEKAKPEINPLTIEETILSAAEAVSSLNSSDDVPELDSERVTEIGMVDAQTAIKEMYDDVINGINTRKTNAVYAKWRRYAASVLAKTDRVSTGLELNNRCRLQWYDQLYRDPVSSVFYAEAFTRELYCNLASGAQGIERGIRQGRAKMDLTPSSPDSRLFITVDSKTKAVNLLKLALVRAAEAHARAIAPLTPAEIKTLTNESFTVFCAQTHYGHVVPSSYRAKYLIDLMEKMDSAAMYDGMEALVPILDSRFLEQIGQISPNDFETVEIDGKTCGRIATPAGNIIIGGPEDNTWNLEEIENLCCLIDTGGNDTYIEGTCNPNRPVLALIDLGDGDDTYVGKLPGIQGGSVLGISLLYNERGNTTYTARDIAQGGTIGGAAILIDGDGNDRYNGFKRVQGAALEGLALLIDRAGADDYHAALLAQGLGHPRGFGVLLDKSGNDHYYVGGYYEDSYPEHPGYDGWGQGLGAGIRGVACGGIGVLLEGAGDDVYEYDYFAHGGGYWMAVGFARDFGGNDQRLGATLKAYTGGNRSQARWQRFSNGFGCHYALGFLFDDAGNDSYNGTIMGLGMAWDLSAGFLVDFDGDDQYAATGGLTQGTGAEGSLGFLFDYRGADEYKGRGQGYASGRITYHQAYDCGGNFSFVVDHGGADKYGSGAKNNMMSQRGTPNGFVIDRPTVEELAESAEGAGASEEELRVQVNKPLPQAGGADSSMEQAYQQFSDSMNSRDGENSPRGGRWGARR